MVVNFCRIFNTWTKVNKLSSTEVVNPYFAKANNTVRAAFSFTESCDWIAFGK